MRLNQKPQLIRAASSGRVVGVGAAHTDNNINECLCCFHVQRRHKCSQSSGRQSEPWVGGTKKKKKKKTWTVTMIVQTSCQCVCVCSEITLCFSNCQVDAGLMVNIICILFVHSLMVLLVTPAGKTFFTHGEVILFVQINSSGKTFVAAAKKERQC